MTFLTYTRNNIWLTFVTTFALGFGVYNIIINNDKITKINEKLDCILENQLRFINLLNSNEKDEIKDEVKEEIKEEIKDDNLDQEYLDDSYDNVPFITKSKHIFKFW